MREYRFFQKLQAMLQNFNKEKARDLSLEIHQAEVGGYELSPFEDNLWQTLTAKIEEETGP